jgi:putative CRISPR-associated protein (TIGR02619 family)
MQTIIMTVGTSLRTNGDRQLSEEQKRPWHTRDVYGDMPIFPDIEEPLAWMKSKDPEIISAETNTFWRLNPIPDDQIYLLYSDTVSGLECAKVLKHYFEQVLGQLNVTLRKIPNIDYELEGSALEAMADLLKNLISDAVGEIILAATGGFKAETMIMGIVGNLLSVPVCYVHESYDALVFLPYLYNQADTQSRIKKAPLPASGRSREDIMSVQGDQAGHHRPKLWKKVEKMLKSIPWIDLVYYDPRASSAPKNGVKVAPIKAQNNQQIIWINIYESQEKKLALSIVTTGYQEEHLREAEAELRERLGRIF